MTAAKTGSQKHTANDGDALDVREPAVAYRTGRGGSAAAEFDEADWDGEEDYGAPESVTVHSYEELCQKLEEARIAREAGQVYPFKEAMRDFWRKVENGQL